MIRKLQIAKEALAEISVKGEENATLYLVVHKNLTDAIKLAAAREQPEVNSDGNDGN